MRRLERTAGHVAGAAAAPAAPSRQFAIAEVPNGALEPRHFALEPAEAAALGDGGVRVCGWAQVLAVFVAAHRDV